MEIEINLSQNEYNNIEADAVGDSWWLGTL